MTTAMKLMKLNIGILATALTMTAALASAQNTDAIDNARSIAKSLQQKQANDTNAALDAAGVQPASKPAPGAPAPAVKPVLIPVSKPAAPSAPHNQLKQVRVVPDGSNIQVEITSSEPVTPRVSKMSSPARVVVELPATVMGSSKSKISVGTAGVKEVRIGMDGKASPTTSVVVDMEKALPYDFTPGSDGKLVLTLHAQAEPAPKAAPSVAPSVAPKVAKNNVAPAAKTSTAAVQKQTDAKPAAVSKADAAKSSPATKSAAKTEVAKSAAAPKAADSKSPATKSTAQSSKPESKSPAKTVVVAKAAPAVAPAKTAAPEKKAEEKKAEEKKWAMTGKRDPFFSPVVQQSGSGCSTGKKCLEINAINLRGVIKSENGYIAVVTNNLNKAYFLRENDPVFNGYVLKITGDSVTFQETFQDKLGKPLTREVVKRLFTPAV